MYFFRPTLTPVRRPRQSTIDFGVSFCFEFVLDCELPTLSAVPSGLNDVSGLVPNVETLGYSQKVPPGLRGHSSTIFSELRGSGLRRHSHVAFSELRGNQRVPSGLNDVSDLVPNVETLGYSQEVPPGLRGYSPTSFSELRDSGLRRHSQTAFSGLRGNQRVPSGLNDASGLVPNVETLGYFQEVPPGLRRHSQSSQLTFKPLNPHN